MKEVERMQEYLDTLVEDNLDSGWPVGRESTGGGKRVEIRTVNSTFLTL